MSTKKKRKPMRLWLVRDIDPTSSMGGDLWTVPSPSEPWLYQQEYGGREVWIPLDDRACLHRPWARLTHPELGHDLAPGECVELRRVP